MIGVALKGLLGRKLRATLTAFAIVLGVAMISGAFVLTDTLGKSFDGILRRVVQVHRRGHQLEGRDRDGGRRDRGACLLGHRSRRRREPARRARRAGHHRGRGEPRRPGRGDDRSDRPGCGDGRRVDRRPEPESVPARLGRVAQRRRSDRNRQCDGREGALPDRPERRSVRRRSARDLRDHRDRPLRVGRLARRRHGLCLRSRGRAAAVRQGGQVRPDQRRRRGRRDGGRAGQPDRPASLRDHAGEDRRGPGERRQRRYPGGTEHHQVLPARLRRHRVVRRQLRDRQHARDHCRAADARTCHAAHPRGFQASGAGLGHPRVARRRPCRLGHRALPGARNRGRPDRAPRSGRHRPAEQRAGVLRADDRSSASPSAP